MIAFTLVAISDMFFAFLDLGCKEMNFKDTIYKNVNLF
jgi:hypothetical protein